jgi:hypothetical protein
METVYWKKIGIYISADTSILVVIGTGNAKMPLDVIKNGNSVEGAVIDADGTIVTLNTMIYNRVGYDVPAISSDYMVAKTRPSALGRSGRTVYIGNNNVYKNDYTGSSSLDKVVQEASRNLYAISCDVPHSICYGIYNEEDKYYFIEELLNIDKTYDMYSMAFIFLTDIDFIRHLTISELSGSNNETSTKLEEITLPYSQYIVQFTKLRDLLIAKDIGGDFKLDNILINNKTNSLVFTDLIFPRVDNPYRPMRWTVWEDIAKAEAPLNIFLSPFARLRFWAERSGNSESYIHASIGKFKKEKKGGLRKRHYTRNNKKRGVRFSRSK